MSEEIIENHIVDVLTGEAQRNALDFIAFLRANEMQFERGKGYWEDKLYWIIKQKDKYVCFILINSGGNKNEPEGWIVWSDDSDSNWFEDIQLDGRIKEIAWRHIDTCGNCGGCDKPGGSHKTIFGKAFDNVCITTFRFDNPDYEAVECIKKLVGLRRKDISRVM